MYGLFNYLFALSVLLHLTAGIHLILVEATELIRFRVLHVFAMASLSAQVASVWFVLFGLWPRSIVALLFSSRRLFLVFVVFPGFRLCDYLRTMKPVLMPAFTVGPMDTPCWRLYHGPITVNSFHAIAC